MTLRRAAAALLLLTLAQVGTTSCLVRRRVITRRGSTAAEKLLSADQAALRARIEGIYKAIQNLNATVDLVPARGSAEKAQITEYKDVRGYILFRKPERIRIIGLYPVVRNKAFDMVSDGSEFRLYIPAKNRFITGPDEVIAPSPNKIENLRPHHFVDALLIRPQGAGEAAVLANLTDEESANYILHILKAGAGGAPKLDRAIWFDRLDLRISRQILFDDNGDILTDARYRDWQTYDNVPFPKQVEMIRPKDEYGVVMTVVKMEINRGVPEERFALERPAGTQLQVLGKPASKPAASLEDTRGEK